MGVPAFFKWLAKRYPKLMTSAECETPIKINGVAQPVDTSAPNKHGFEIDNLYLDMNGIIHPCCHPEDKDAPNTEEDMMQAICEYIDHLFNIVRPRKLLYMAIDGVAPRAKMNQQRARRFRSAKEAERAKQLEEEERKVLRAKGEEVPEPKGEQFDSNCITPGTEFMDKIAKTLRYYAAHRQQNDPGWKDICVLITDSNVPGEGEHKIMDYIRYQRVQPGYNPNLRHCIYGLDADLIMLGLATHEPHFLILREELQVRQPGVCFKCNHPGHLAAHCNAPVEKKVAFGEGGGKMPPFQFLHVEILREYLQADFKSSLKSSLPFEYDGERVLDDFVFLCFFVGNDFLPHLPTLEIREGAINNLVAIYKKVVVTCDDYLTKEGNVNLPAVQAILKEIAPQEDTILQNRATKERVYLAREAAREDRLAAEKSACCNACRRDQVTGRSSCACLVHVDLLTNKSREITVNGCGRCGCKGCHPDKVSKKFKTYALGRKSSEAKSNAKSAASAANSSSADVEMKDVTPAASNDEAAAALRAALTGDDEQDGEQMEKDGGEETQNEAAEGAKKRTRSSARIAAAVKKAKVSVEGVDPDADAFDEGEEVTADSAAAPAGQSNNGKENGNGTDANDASDEDDEDDEDDVDDGIKKVVDDVKLGEEGWRGRYYKSKFGVEMDDAQFFESIRRSYLEGLCWVLRYYYQGCNSWDWYYPYHYAPFAGELQHMEDIIETGISLPTGEPFRPFEQLMSVLPPSSGRKFLPKAYADLMNPDSPVADFYPEEFEEDLNGKPAKLAWLAVVILPFIDEKRLLSVMEGLEATLTEDEKRRNSPGVDVLFVHTTHSVAPIAKKTFAMITKDAADDEPVGIPPSAGNGFAGDLLPYRDGFRFGKPLPAPFDYFDSIDSLKCCVVVFKNPSLPEGAEFNFGLVEGVDLPKKSLTPFDLQQVYRPAMRGGGFRGGSRGRGYSGSYYMNQNAASSRNVNMPFVPRGRGGFPARAAMPYQPFASRAPFRAPPAFGYARGAPPPARQFPPRSFAAPPARSRTPAYTPPAYTPPPVAYRAAPAPFRAPSYGASSGFGSSAPPARAARFGAAPPAASPFGGGPAAPSYGSSYQSSTAVPPAYRAPPPSRASPPAQPPPPSYSSYGASNGGGGYQTSSRGGYSAGGNYQGGGSGGNYGSSGAGYGSSGAGYGSSGAGYGSSGAGFGSSGAGYGSSAGAGYGSTNPSSHGSYGSSSGANNYGSSAGYGSSAAGGYSSAQQSYGQRQDYGSQQYASSAPPTSYAAQAPPTSYRQQQPPPPQPPQQQHQQPPQHYGAPSYRY